MMSLKPRNIDFQETWANLKETVAGVVALRAVERAVWNTRFSDVYALCVAHPEPLADRLYDETRNFLEEHVSGLLERVRGDSPLENSDHNDGLLERYVTAWREYSQGVEYLNNLYSYLNLQHVKRQKMFPYNYHYGPPAPPPQQPQVVYVGAPPPQAVPWMPSTAWTVPGAWAQPPVGWAPPMAIPQPTTWATPAAAPGWTPPMYTPPPPSTWFTKTPGYSGRGGGGRGSSRGRGRGGGFRGARRGRGAGRGRRGGGWRRGGRGREAPSPVPPAPAPVAPAPVAPAPAAPAVAPASTGQPQEMQGPQQAPQGDAAT